jgi:EAL domain-containing protein (putative c-di-GMP-specific phosphodiesterase class I)
MTLHMLPKLMKDMLILTDVEPLVVSFNTSARDFEDDIFTRALLKTVETSRLAPDAVQVEITESVALGAGEAIRRNIRPLSQAGIGLAMDDFATGYSSLDTLSRWPFTTIKLDQGMVGRMMASQRNATIVNSSIRMAHELGIEVIAEGVEDRDQHQYLLESGCNHIQGFWISRALPLDQFINFVEQDTRWSGLPVGLIHMAVMDHVQWRKQLASSVLRAVSFPKNSVQRVNMNLPALECHECRLGRWYYGEGRMFQGRPIFQSLEKPHEEVHETGLRLTQMARDGASLQEITPLLRVFAEQSMMVLGLLQDLEDEALENLHHSTSDENYHLSNYLHL